MRTLRIIDPPPQKKVFIACLILRHSANPYTSPLRTSEGKASNMDYTTNTAPLAVTQQVTVELIDSTGTGAPIDAELHYDSTDPYAVSMIFIIGPSRVRWTFGRDLLTQGLYEPPATGAVHVGRCLTRS